MYHNISKIVFTVGFILLSFLCAAQPWSFNFGDASITAPQTNVNSTINALSGFFNSRFSGYTGANALPTSPDGGTYKVRAGSSASGTDGTVRITDATTSPNLSLGRRIVLHGKTGAATPVKLAISDFSASKSGYVRFNVILGNATGVASTATAVDGSNFYFFLGNGPDYTGSNLFTNSQTMFGLRGTFSNNLIGINYRNAGGWTITNLANANPGRNISQGVKYTFEVYYNNTTAAINYHRLGTNSLAANSVDLWINHTKVNTGNIRNTGAGSPYANDDFIDSFQFIMQDNNGAAFIDDLEYSNALPTSANPTLYGVTSGDLASSLNFVSTNGPLTTIPNSTLRSAAFGGYDLSIPDGVNITHNLDLQRIRNITIANGGTLSGANNTPNSPVYLNIFGDITNNGTLGGESASGLGLNIEDGTHTISGTGTAEIARIRCSDQYSANANLVSLTIDQDMTLNWTNSASIFNNASTAGKNFNVTVAANKTLTLKGDLSMDGIDGQAVANRGGSYTINGTVAVEGKAYLLTNNTLASSSCSLIVNSGGTFRVASTGSIVTGASGEAGHIFQVNNGANFILETNGINAFRNTVLNASAPFTINNTYTFGNTSNFTVKNNATDALPSSDIFNYGNLILDSGTVFIDRPLNIAGELSLINSSLLEMSYSSANTNTFSKILTIDNSTLDLNVATSTSNVVLNRSLNIVNGGIVKLTSGTGNLNLKENLGISGATSGFVGGVNLNFIADNFMQDIAFTNGATDIAVRNLSINHTATNVNNRLLRLFDGNVTVNNILNLTQGSILTQGNKIILGASGTISGESSTNKVTGYLETTKASSQNVNQAFGGLGLQINCLGANPNSFTVLRTTGALAEAVNPNNSANKSALRKYKITGYDNAGSLNATAVFSYLEDELNGIPEGDVQLARSSDDGLTWNAVRSGTRNATSNNITLTGVQSFSDWIIQNQNAPLPVTLSYFTGKSTATGNALSWETLAELNNQGFRVERSLTGEEGSFQVLTFVKGKGTTNAKQRYSYADIGFNSAAYYRLTQVDFDGKETLSPIVFVSKTEEKAKIEIYPNPVKDKLFVHLQGMDLAQELSVSLSTLDAKVLAKANTTAEGLSSWLNGHLPKLKQGLYIISIQGNGLNTTLKMMKE